MAKRKIPHVTEVRDRLHAWILRFIGMTGKRADERVSERWNEIDQLPLLALRETLATFKVCAIVDAGTDGMINAVRPNSDEECGNNWFLAPPVDRAVIDSRLEELGLDGVDCLGELLYYFGGLG